MDREGPKINRNNLEYIRQDLMKEMGFIPRDLAPCRGGQGY